MLLDVVVVEAPGVEPGSEKVSEEASTGVAAPFGISRGGPAVGGLPSLLVHPEFRPLRRWSLRAG